MQRLSSRGTTPRLTLGVLAALVGFGIAPLASAALQQHSFIISGGGVTGSGTFTWDDTVIPNGTVISFAAPTNIQTLSITLNGAAVGGTTTFSKPDCTQVVMDAFPNFANDLNFWCNNGSFSLTGVEVYANELNPGGIALTISPGAFAPPVPALSEWAMILLSGALALATALVLRRRTR